MEAPRLQGSGEVKVPDAPDRKGGLESRASQPAFPTPISRTRLPFTPSGYGHSGASTTTGYSPFRGVEAEHYEILCVARRFITSTEGHLFELN